MCKAQKVHVKSIISARVVEARVMTSREKRLTGKRAFGSFSCFVSRLVAFAPIFLFARVVLFELCLYKAGPRRERAVSLMMIGGWLLVLAVAVCCGARQCPLYSSVPRYKTVAAPNLTIQSWPCSLMSRFYRILMPSMQSLFWLCFCFG